jgi:hypothetical protein
MFTVNRYVLCPLFTDDDIVVQPDGMENRFKVVITVLAFAYDIQIEVDFRVGANLYISHDFCLLFRQFRQWDNFKILR